jgi:hypothetical protein
MRIANRKELFFDGENVGGACRRGESSGWDGGVADVEPVTASAVAASILAVWDLACCSSWSR